MNNRMMLARLCIFIAIKSFSGGYADDSSTLPRLVINRKYYDAKIVTEEKREGENIILNCEYTKSPTDNMSPILEWYHDGKKVDEVNTEQRVYILQRNMREHTTGLKLTLKNLQTVTDDGVYECRATSTDRTVVMSRQLKLQVIKAAHWINNDKIAAGSLAGELVINCEAEGDPAPDIAIQLKDGSELPERYRRDGSNVKIDNLEMADRNQEVICTAAQLLENVDDNPVIVKIVTIDVYYNPSFENGAETTRYGILDRNVSIPCRVTDSNPNVIEFMFFEEEDGESASKSEHDFTVNLITQSAFLEIKKLEDHHFRKIYTCTAKNGKHMSSQKIHLEKTDSPQSPTVAHLESDEVYSIKWQIEDLIPRNQLKILPILKYHVRYIEEKSLGVNANDLSNNLWNSAKEIEFIKKPSNVYKISGLKQSTRYAFRFQSINEAGSSDWGQILISEIVGHSNRRSSKGSLARTSIWCLVLPQLIIFIRTIYYQTAGR